MERDWLLFVVLDGAGVILLPVKKEANNLFMI